MRQKFIRELRKNLKLSNLFWEEDIKDMIHVANMTFKKCKREEKKYRKKKHE